jgi:hypothetical protein
MWLLILLTLINAAVGSRGFLFDFRFSLVGMPVNIIDVMVFLGVFLAMFQPRSSLRTPTHPLFKWAVVLSVIGLLGGAVMGMANLSQGASVRNYVTYARNYLALPMGAMIGYRLLANARSVRVFPYVAAVAGCVTAVVMILTFRSRAARFGYGSSIEVLRSIDYVIPYAGIAAGLLAFSLASGVRLFPLLLAAPMAALCALGGTASLSRSDWLAMAAGVVGVFLCLPRERRMLRMVQAVCVTGLLVGGLFAGVYATSRMTGHDFFDKMMTRVRSMLPGEQEGVQAKAWDTRLYGAGRELEEFLQNPVLGRGFGIQDTGAMLDADNRGARHNSWTNALVETGLPGFAAAVLFVGGIVVIGRRMILSGTDRGSVLMGALGVVTGAHFFVLGMATGGFNNQRQGLLVGLTFGLVVRARAIQQAMVAEYAGYVDGPDDLRQFAEAEYGYPAGYGQTV